MAGYIIYSLDWPKFSALVERPTPTQLSIFARHIADGRDGLRVLGWPTAPNLLVPIAADRLARTDWYGDLSRAGKEFWEATIFTACMDSSPAARPKFDLGFRVDSDGVYWDVINLITKWLGDQPEAPGKSAMSRFGTVPFRYHPPEQPGSSDWFPTHSMHPPDEVRRMLAELQSVAPALQAM